MPKRTRAQLDREVATSLVIAGSLTPHSAKALSTLAQMGNAVASAAHAAEVLKREPTFSVAAHLATQHYKQDLDRARYETGLLKAGLPA